jgi:hypothetical protein
MDQWFGVLPTYMCHEPNHYGFTNKVNNEINLDIVIVI